MNKKLPKLPDFVYQAYTVVAVRVPKKGDIYYQDFPQQTSACNGNIIHFDMYETKAVCPILKMRKIVKQEYRIANNGEWANRGRVGCVWPVLIERGGWHIETEVYEFEKPKLTYQQLLDKLAEVTAERDIVLDRVKTLEFDLLSLIVIGILAVCVIVYLIVSSYEG